MDMSFSELTERLERINSKLTEFPSRPNLHDVYFSPRRTPARKIVNNKGDTVSVNGDSNQNENLVEIALPNSQVFKWKLFATKEYMEWFSNLDAKGRNAVIVAYKKLGEYGPLLTRPTSDTLKGSKIGNLKELRVKNSSHIVRIAYCFDAKRRAVFLMGGDKKGKSDEEFYRWLIPTAENIAYKYNIKEGEGIKTMSEKYVISQEEWDEASACAMVDMLGEKLYKLREEVGQDAGGIINFCDVNDKDWSSWLPDQNLTVRQLFKFVSALGYDLEFNLLPKNATRTKCESKVLFQTNL